MNRLTKIIASVLFVAGFSACGGGGGGGGTPESFSGTYEPHTLDTLDESWMKYDNIDGGRYAQDRIAKWEAKELWLHP